jgi:hypothetical protein
MTAYILSMCIWWWLEKNIKRPTENRNKQSQAQKTSLDNPWRLLANPQPENNDYTNYLVNYEQA